jgi:hypothetical protein
MPWRLSGFRGITGPHTSHAAVFRSADESSAAQIDLKSLLSFHCHGDNCGPRSLMRTSATWVAFIVRLFKRWNCYIQCFARVSISTAFFTAVSSPHACLACLEMQKNTLRSSSPLISCAAATGTLGLVTAVFRTARRLLSAAGVSLSHWLFGHSYSVT